MDSLFYYGLIFLLQFLSVVSSLHIIIDGEDGVLSPVCLHDGGQPCKSLQYVAANLPTTNQSNLTLEIISSYLIINEVIIFSDINGLTLIGQGVNNTTITCNKTVNTSGLSITDSSQIRFVGFTLLNCGGLNHPNSSLVSIFIGDSTDLEVLKVSIRHSNGYGMFILNVSGNVSIESCTFAYNGYIQIPHYKRGHGGLRILLVSTAINYIFIHNCSFCKNRAINSTKNWKSHYNHGGGLRVVLEDTHHSTVVIDHCYFRNNTASFAAGILIRIVSNSTNNALYINDSTFESNKASVGGGAADVGYTNVNKSYPNNNKMLFNRCTFKQNIGNFGGGVAIFTGSVTLRYSNQVKNRIHFNNCTFTKNAANGGAAVHVIRDQVNGHGSYYITNIFLTNCQFIKNTAGTYPNEDAIANSSSIRTQSGVVYTNEVWVYFSGHTLFQGNNGTALHVSAASVKFEDNSQNRFLNNNGDYGGAILLMDRAQLSLGKNTDFVFAHNKASFYGGAICSLNQQSQYSEYTEKCFVDKRSSSVVNITFTDNKANSGFGNDAFVSNLKPCLVKCSKSHDDINALFTDRCFNEFNYSGNFSIATATDRITIDHPSKIIPIIPGVLTYINVTQYDQYNHTVNKLFPLSVSIMKDHSDIKVDLNYAIITDNYIRLLGSPMTNGTLLLHTNTIASVGVAVQVKLTHCSPGYVFNADKQACHCSAWNVNTTYRGIHYCEDVNATIAVGYWAGYLDKNNMTDDTFVTGICNIDLCNFNGSRYNLGKFYLSNESSVLEKTVCGPYRQGILCGQCIANYSTYYHSPSFKCGMSDNCHYGILLYIVSELLPITIIFIVIIIFDIYLTSGTLYTFIFYAQILDIFFVDGYRLIRFNKFISIILYTFRNIYGMADFSILYTDNISFCIVNNATIMDLFLFKYLTTIYALFLILTTIIILKVNSLYTCIKLCHKCGRRNIRGSVINGLTAFLVLCYCQCIYITYCILLPINLYGKGDKKNKTVPLLQGDLEYMKGKHLHYAIPAIICLIMIILPPPIILISEPVLVKLSGLISMRRNAFTYCLHRIRMKLKPFLDSFQGCFKDNCRCFAGFFFLYRIVIYLPVLYTESIGRCFTHATIVLVLVVMIHAILQPFHKKWHNNLDIFLLSNILLVNILTTINYYSSLWQRTNRTILIGQLLLIALPLVYISGYFTYHLCRKFKRQFPCQTFNSVYLRFVKHEDIAGDSFPSRLLEEESPLSSSNSYRSVPDYSKN